MLNTLASVILWGLGICVGLYLLWQFMERFDHYMIRRRRAKIDKEAGGQSICKWGFDSNGELFHVRCKRTTEN